MGRKKIKASGTNFEYRVTHELEECGWTVFRSAGSHSCADLIAYRYRKQVDRRPRNLWIQCKASEKPYLNFEEKADLIRGERAFGITALVVCREPKPPWSLLYYILESKKFVMMEEPEWILLV